MFSVDYLLTGLEVVLWVMAAVWFKAALHCYIINDDKIYQLSYFGEEAPSPSVWNPPYR